MSPSTTPNLGGVFIRGKVKFLPTANVPHVELRAAWILLGTNSTSLACELTLGTEAAPIASGRSATLTLIKFEGGTVTATNPEDPDGNSGTDSPAEVLGAADPGEIEDLLRAGGLVVFERGKLYAFGEAHDHSWVQLESFAATDAEDITVEAADGELDTWYEKEIVIASTDFDSEQAEVFIVTAVGSGANPTLDLDGMLEFDHYALEYQPASTNSDWQVDEKAEVGLLTRNAVIQAETGTWNGSAYDWTDGTGEHGHVILTRDTGGPQPIGRFSWTRFKNLGVEGEVMMYPLHLHLCGDYNYSSTGSMIKHCSFTQCFNKFLAVHNTQDIEVIGNVGYDTIGNGFYLEDDATTGIILQDNLGLGVKALDMETFSVGSQDLEPAVFWYASSNNKISGNHAAGSSDYGFWYHPGPSTTSLTFVVNGTDAYFRGNVAHSNRQIGFYQEKIADEDEPQRARPWYDTITHYQLEDCTFYKNRRYGLWLRTYGRVHLNNIRVADNRSGFYLASNGFQEVTIDGPDSAWRTLSHIRLYDSLAIGETSNLGFEDVSRPQEDEANRSMPQVIPFLDWAGRPHEIPWAALTGIELYDGLIELENVRFADFEDFDDLNYTSGGSSSYATRIGTGITQVAYDSQYMIDPRNLAYGLEFAGTVSHQVHFRYPTGAMGANMIKNTILYDEDGSASGVGAGYLVPLDEPFLYEGIDGGDLTELTSDGVMFVEDAAVAYGSLVVTPLEATSPLTVWTKVKHEYNVPNADVAQFVRDAAGEHRYPLTVPLNNWYTLTFFDGSQPPAEIATPPDDIKLELRFAEQEGDWIIIAVPWGATVPDTIEVDFQQADEASDFESLESSAVNAFWWDSTNQYVIVKIIAKLPSGYGSSDLLTTGTQNICRIEQ